MAIESCVGKGGKRWCGKRKKKFNEYSPPPEEQVVGRIAAVLAGAFQVLSTAYLRMVCVGFDCSEVKDALAGPENSTDTSVTKHYFLETEPDIECCRKGNNIWEQGWWAPSSWAPCAVDSPYLKIQFNALIGLFAYLLMLGYFTSSS